ncbi:transferrin receptor-like dimerization domain-containing protein [Saccharicrinis sp. FJH2]|uniref:transferrin receptor-like dimerization domain-containing protein n=1 Tax=Saccharicrinis sp. FJH65 TaxID=3344659 RepID=UPI0035F440A1
MKHIYFLFGFLFVLQFGMAQETSLTGFYSSSVEKQLKLETDFDSNLSAAHIGEMIKKMSAKPHHLGSDGSKENAEYILKKFKSWGWDAEIETFYVLFPTPKKRLLEMVEPVSFKAGLKESVLKEDPATALPGQLPTYNAYSADGDVTAELVFVNYGLPDDYAVLDKMGVDVKGKIVIAKYGHSWRGIKPKIAQEHGAVGCIIYSDPADDGYKQGDVYPKGAFKNSHGVQRGSVMDMVVYPGDPTTPGYGSVKDADHLDHSKAENLLKIPVLPISYSDATPLLKALEGEVAPVGWQGNLPFTYHLGPGKARVHLSLAFNWDIVPCYDVIAKIEGSRYPDEWVIRGNHQDAWVHGASDPISGLAALMEEARSIGEMKKNGWTPDRTLIYCAWDGEEPGLLGSTEWVEAHEKELKEHAVLYVNSDGNGRGFLFAQGSHALEPLMDEIAKDVPDPQTNVSVFERLKAGRIVNEASLQGKENIWKENNLKLYAMGSGSDYSSFIQHIGIPALNLGFYGENEGGEYHTNFDTYTNFVTFKDPGFHYGVALAETAGRAVLRMANADVLPYDFEILYQTILGYSKELISLIDKSREGTDFENTLIQNHIYDLGEDPTKKYKLPDIKPEVPYLDFSPLENALSALKAGVDSVTLTYNAAVKYHHVSEAFNRLLSQAEQQLLIADGLPGRSWYKHVLYAPGFYTGYGVKTMPGIREAIEQKDWDLAQKQIQVAADRINHVAGYFMAYKGS